MFKSPGGLEELDHESLKVWNDMIMKNIERQSASRFFKSNPDDIANGQEIASFRWSGAPAEPRFCLNRDWAQKLSDWNIRGRHETHNEYCEYRVVTAVDAQGRVRPKRVEFTSELREYWVVLAMKNPQGLQNAVENIIGRKPTWRELYDHDDPSLLNEDELRVRFSIMVAGNGNHRDLIDANVPSQPQGPLNRDNILFLTHPINGLDDLIYVVMFGATPYKVNDSSGERKALLQEIFRAFGVEHLACRNADPAAAAGPFDVVSEGREVAFAKNLGMYLRPLNKEIFEYNGNSIPDAWIKYSRGNEGMYQRLVIGPSDADNAYLDDIYLKKGAAKERIIGGYQIAEMLEVGPLVVVGDPSIVNPSDVKFVPPSPSAINCSQAGVCSRMKQLKDDYLSSNIVISGGSRGGI
jgi:hypothetical protein